MLWLFISVAAEFLAAQKARNWGMGGQKPWLADKADYVRDGDFTTANARIDMPGATRLNRVCSWSLELHGYAQPLALIEALGHGAVLNAADLHAQLFQLEN